MAVCRHIELVKWTLFMSLEWSPNMLTSCTFELIDFITVIRLAGKHFFNLAVDLIAKFIG